MARPVDQTRRALPLAEWPDADRLAWDVAIAGGDVLDGCGPGAHWAPATKRTNVQHYGRWLGYLQHGGRLEANLSPADRVTVECVRTYNQHLATIVAPRTRLSLLVGLKVMMQVMAPERSWRWLQDMCNWVQRNAPPQTDKRSRMRPSAELYATALEELARLPTSSLSLKDAVVFRDALMLALLAARPIRVKNMAAISLDRQLIKVDEIWVLIFSADETKNRSPLEYLLPESLVPWLERYLTEVRPIFPGADTTRSLWLGQDGAVRSPYFVYQRITRLTNRLFGSPLNPHLLRDCAATSLALVSPDAARAAAPLLGHRHFSTTERYYVQATSLEASRRLNELLARAKASLGEGT